MWAIIKINKKNLSLLKKDFLIKLGSDVKFFIPKLKLNIFNKSKILTKESFLLGDYILCFHEGFAKKSILSSLKYSKGLKYFLTDFFSAQKEIEKFILKCRENEDDKGYIKSSFFDLKKSKDYEFISGPFTRMIFSVINENKINLKILIGNRIATVSKERNLFRPV
ncbi:hypothetical protein OA346_01145 [Candidatus Pelagibacter sp.]|nr:hypothetical protein [Candidatus Pelagibacter sp.]